MLQDCWIDDPEFGRIPLEVSLLTKLVHPNIVEVSWSWVNDLLFLFKLVGYPALPCSQWYTKTIVKFVSKYLLYVFT